jgi:pyrrolidone-carboxylate peptidase
MMERDGDDNIYVVLHMGVYQGSGKFNIELQGRNIKHFRIPDERGNTPLDQCIAEGFDISHCIQTRLAVDSLVERLQGKGHNVSKSLSAGEYICNYTYFCSLQASQHKVPCPDKVFTLFCHVPTFLEIDEPSQQKFLIDLVRVIRETV